MLAHTSTLLPRYCPSGLLGLDHGCLLQTTSWDAPQQNIAPAPLCLFRDRCKHILCTRTRPPVNNLHIQQKVAHSAAYFDWSKPISQTPELMALPNAHTYPHATVEGDIRIHIPACHPGGRHSTPFCFTSIMTNRINISQQQSAEELSNHN